MKPEIIKNYDEIMTIVKSYDLGQEVDLKSVDKETAKNVIRDRKILEKYRKTIKKISKKDGELKENLMDIKYMLPPWLAYPEKKPTEIAMTEYNGIYKLFKFTLNNMERSAYEQKYPMPKNW